MKTTDTSTTITTTEEDFFAQFKNTEKGFTKPLLPLNVKNNGQIGRWVIGGEELNDFQFLLLNVQQFFGDLGYTFATNWLQMWFVPLDGILSNTICYTYLKSLSAQNFLNTLNLASCKFKTRPELLLWSARFEKKSFVKEGQTVNFYCLSFSADPQLPLNHKVIQALKHEMSEQANPLDLFLPHNYVAQEPTLVSLDAKDAKQITAPAEDTVEEEPAF